MKLQGLMAITGLEITSQDLSRKAVRGSGGVRVLVKSSMCQNWLIEILDVALEDVIIIWVKFQHKKSCCVFFVAVCHVPPIGSS